MSHKRHKKKHRKESAQSHAEHVEQHVEQKEEHHLQVIEQPRQKGIRLSAYLFVFTIGLLIGIIAGLLIMRVSPSEVFASFESEQEYTEIDAAEKGALPKIEIPPVEEVLTKTSTTTAFYYFMVGKASATSSPLSIRVPTFVYHSVRPHVEGESKYQDTYDVTPELLEEELIYLRDNGYHTIGFDDIYAYWTGAKSSLPEKPVILSFDDGWKSQFEYAFPLLKKYEQKGVFFIFTNPINNKKAKWMSWSDIRELDAAGMEIGGHSFTHPELTKIHNDAVLDREIKDSKKEIEEKIGHPIIAFAYPFGLKNEQTLEALSRAGYKFGRTIERGVWNDPDHNLKFHGTLTTDNIEDFKRLLREK